MSLLSGSSFYVFEGLEGNLVISGDRHTQGNLVTLAGPIVYVLTFWIFIPRI